MRQSRRAAFTLVEVLLVMVILVILVSFAGTYYVTAQKRAQVNAARTQIGLFEQPLDLYHLSVNEYPSTDQGLQALRTAPAGLVDPAKWDGPYLKKEIPLDPWGQPYQYESPGRHNADTFDIWSFGPDRANNTADDVGNWEN